LSSPLAELIALTRLPHGVEPRVKESGGRNDGREGWLKGRRREVASKNEGGGRARKGTPNFEAWLRS